MTKMTKTPDSSPSVGVNEFVRRQVDGAGFTWTTHSFERVAEMARENFANAIPGYREGVVKVPVVDPEGFFTPVVEAERVNNTVCLDTGCVFGGKLTALRWPEQELVSVPAHKEYSPLRRGFGLPPVRPKKEPAH